METKNERLNSMTSELSSFFEEALHSHHKDTCSAHPYLVKGVCLSVKVGQRNEEKLNKIDVKLERLLDMVGNRAGQNQQQQATISFGKAAIRGPWQVVILLALVLAGGAIGIGGMYAVTKLFLDDKPQQQTERQHVRNP